MKSVLAGIRDLRKHIILNTVFVVLMTRLSGPMLMNMYEYGTQRAISRWAMQLKEENTCFMKSSRNIHETARPGEVNSIITNLINEGKAVIITEAYDDEGMEIGAVVVGDPGELISPEIEYRKDEMFALTGKKSGFSVSDKVRIGDAQQLSVPVEGYLENGSRIYIGMNLNTITMDDKSVFFIPLSVYLTAFYHNELTERVFLRGCTNEEIASLMKTGEQSGYKMDVNQMYALAKRMYPEQTANYVVFLFTLYLTGFFFLFFTVGMILYLTAESNTKEYMIHLTYGARPYHLVIRSLTSSLVLTLPPLGYSLYRIIAFGFTEYISILKMGVYADIALCLIISLYTVFRFVRNDYASFIHVKE